MTSGVKYIAYPNASGYGLAGLAYVRALHNAGVPVWWQPWFLGGEPHPWAPAAGLPTLPLARAAEADSGLADVPALIDACTRPIAYDTIVVHTVPEQFAPFIEPGKRVLGCTVWETDALPAHWPRLLNAVHAVVVPSRFTAEIFARDGLERPVHVVPHVRRHAWSAASRDDAIALRLRLRIPEDHFVFYTIAAWDPRKALEELMVAFAEAFAPDEPVTLLIKTSATIGNAARHGGSPVEQRARRIAQVAAQRLGRPRANFAVIAADDVGARTIDAINALGDCYLSLTHGEGWGMGAFEAATLGKPVLITGWGGPLDFLGDDYPGLIRYRLAPVAGWRPHASYQPSQRWAEPDLEHAAALMRAAAAGDSTLAEAAERVRETIVNRFAEPIVAREFMAAIDG